jgi:hypothetical protein
MGSVPQSFHGQSSEQVRRIVTEVAWAKQREARCKIAVWRSAKKKPFAGGAGTYEGRQQGCNTLTAFGLSAIASTCSIPLLGKITEFFPATKALAVTRNYDAVRRWHFDILPHVSCRG